MKKIDVFVFIALVCAIIGGINRQMEINRLRALLNDPHHCISICIDELEKMGC